MAKTTKTSVGDAVGVLETAARLAELPNTDAALRSGELSEPQAREIAAAASAAPQAEDELLARARRDSLGGLRERCAEVRAAATPEESERYERVRARRRLRHWIEPDGAFRLDAVLTADAGAVVLAALEPLTEDACAAARRQGRREPREACAADALVALAAHGRDCDAVPERRGPAALVHVVVDHAALTRGAVQTGETCAIVCVGPIPAATARALAADAILSVLVKDGGDLRAISGAGRTITARLRSALVACDTQVRGAGLRRRTPPRDRPQSVPGARTGSPCSPTSPAFVLTTITSRPTAATASGASRGRGRGTRLVVGAGPGPLRDGGSAGSVHFHEAVGRAPFVVPGAP
jgi:Domain of unknown function (DUF222)